ncbi:MAG: hypothetical protein JNL58_09105 [Planctomyces sp.]|nr:hypothetical protein [Planctomyces sp.]
MHFRRSLAVARCLLMSVICCSSLAAQEFLPNPTELSESAARNTPDWFEPLTPQESSHAGLLGKRYFEGRYLNIDLDDVPDELNADFEGFAVGFNTPLLQSKEEFPFQIDGFTSWTRLSFSTNLPFPTFAPPFITMASVKVAQDAIDVGTTLHTSAFAGFRPFLQLGVRLTRDRVYMNIPGFGEFKDRDHEEEFLFVPGFEADITRYVALRTAFDLQLEEDVDNSPVFIDLIAWPHPMLFVRAGFITALDGSATGFTAGGGLSF